MPQSSEHTPHFPTTTQQTGIQCRYTDRRRLCIAFRPFRSLLLCCDKMNVNIGTMTGLNIYRELIEKEKASPAKWAANFGVDKQLQKADPQKLVKISGFEAAKSLPSPLALQLITLQRERLQALRESRARARSKPPPAAMRARLLRAGRCVRHRVFLIRTRVLLFLRAGEWEAKTYPRYSRPPVSQTSVDLYGEKAFTQRPHAEKRARPLSAPVSFSQGPPHRCAARARACCSLSRRGTQSARANLVRVSPRLRETRSFAPAAARVRPSRDAAAAMPT